jgi:hypothetical protein
MSAMPRPPVLDRGDPRRPPRGRGRQWW